MSDDQFRDFLEQFQEDMNSLLRTKGTDYTVTSDRLDNFKRVAEAVGVTPMQIWAVYFTKHVIAACNFARTGKLESEPIRSRFLDIANYAVLGAALAEEGTNGHNA